MADAVTTVVVKNEKDEYVAHFTCISDGTGESTVKKVDISTLTSTLGTAPISLDIRWVRWSVQGFAYIKILWDHNTDDVALALSGNGYDEWEGRNIATAQFRSQSGLKDPRSTGGDGSILFTSSGAVSGATYDITIGFFKNPV